MPMTKFYVVYRNKEQAEKLNLDLGWYVRTRELGRLIDIGGPYGTKPEALDYATDRAKFLGSPASVLAQKKGDKRFQTESTFPRSADPPGTKGAKRKKT